MLTVLYNRTVLVESCANTTGAAHSQGPNDPADAELNKAPTGTERPSGCQTKQNAHTENKRPDGVLRERSERRARQDANDCRR